MAVNPTKIAIIGASMVDYEYGDPDPTDYAQVLKNNNPNWDVAWMAFPGTGYAHHNISVLDTLINSAGFDPEVVCIDFGVRDLLDDVAGAVLGATAAAWAARCHERGICCLLFDSAPAQKWFEWTGHPDQAGLQTETNAFNFTVLLEGLVGPKTKSFGLYGVLGDGDLGIEAAYNIGDGLHPNQDGADAIAAGVEAVLGAWDIEGVFPPKTKGFLEYGSQHDSVLIDSELTSEADIVAQMAALGHSDNSAGSYTIDSSGYLGQGGYLRFNGSGLTALSKAGQISVDVETAFACVSDATFGSMGATLGEHQCLICVAASSSYIACGRRYSGAKTGPRGFVGGAGTTINIMTGEASKDLWATTVGKGPLTRVNLGWWENPDDDTEYIFCAGIDGIPQVYNTVAKSSLGTLGDFYIGSRQTTDKVTDYRIKNLTVSSAAPAFDSPRRVVMFSDSTSNTHSMISSPEYDSGHLYGMLRYWATKGEHIWPGNCGVYRNPGYNVSATTQPSLLDTGSPISNRADAIAKNPTDVVIMAGTNDATGGTLPADYQTSLATIAASFTTAERIVYAGPRSFQADIRVNADDDRAARDEANGIMRAAGTFVDLFALHGGDNPVTADYIFLGIDDATYLNLHPAALAYVNEAIPLAQALDGDVSVTPAITNAIRPAIRAAITKG